MGNKVGNRRRVADQNKLQNDPPLKTKIILLLGSSQSGKSTIYKQFRQIYGDPLKLAELRKYGNHIHDHCICQMKDALDRLNDFQDESALRHTQTVSNYDTYCVNEEKGDTPGFVISDLSEQGTEAANYIRDLDSKNDKLDDEIVAALKTLWKEPAIKKIYEMRNITKIEETVSYFWDKLDELNDKDWVPDTADILLLRLRTTGSIETEYDIKDGKGRNLYTFKIIDVGGTRSERKKWCHLYDSVTAVIFVASLSCYDEVLFQSDTANAMTDQLELFDSVINDDALYKRNRSMILFLNKKDLFLNKIKRVPLKKCPSFATYDGEPHSYDQTTKYIRNAFTSLNKNARTRNVFTHITCATDGDHIQKVFADVQHIVIEASLVQAGLLDFEVIEEEEQKHNEQEDMENEADVANEHQNEVVDSLLAKIKSMERAQLEQKMEWEAVINSMQDKMDKLEASNAVYQEEHKENQLKIHELEEKIRKMNAERIDPSQFMDWGHDAVLTWIMSLEKGKFRKYESVLRQGLIETDVNGADLLNVNQLVIKIWGIKNSEDQRLLTAHIKQLVLQHASPEVAKRATIVSEGAPTEYH